MSERLTDEQLRAVARSFTEQSIEAAAVNEAIALRASVAELEAALKEKTGEAERQYDYNVSQVARVAELEAALQQSVELQSHYAELLNMYDGGQRLTFANAEAWLDRLAALKDAPQ